MINKRMYCKWITHKNEIVAKRQPITGETGKTVDDGGDCEHIFCL